MYVCIYIYDHNIYVPYHSTKYRPSYSSTLSPIYIGIHTLSSCTLTLRKLGFLARVLRAERATHMDKEDESWEGRRAHSLIGGHPKRRQIDGCFVSVLCFIICWWLMHVVCPLDKKEKSKVQAMGSNLTSRNKNIDFPTTFMVCFAIY